MDDTEGYEEALRRIAECKRGRATSLNLSELNLTELPGEIAELKWLKELDCGWNQLSDLSPLTGISGLKELKCWKNRISDLSPLAEISGLEGLNCSGNQISDLSPLSDLSDLERLDCNSNEIIDLSHLSSLSKLKKLDCWRNMIIDLSPLFGLNELKELDCNRNRIINLSPLSGLSKLERLNCEANKIIDLSPLSGLSELKRLDCYNNLIKTPPQEVISQGIEAIREYFSQRNSDKKALNEIKVMFIGTGGAGKTTIRQRLCGDQLNPDEQGTQGIEVRRWNTKYQNKKLRLNLWDFAGQEINYSLHELFFTSRTIYVVVLNGREEDSPEKWLEKVELLGGEESKIIVVRNKTDDAGFRVNPNFNFSQLKEQYSGIAPELLEISAREGGNSFDNFEKALLEMVINHPQTSDQYPLRYLRIKDKVEEYTAEERNHINYTTYENICREEGIDESESTKRLLNILSNLGTVTYFDDPELNNIQILNPAWLSGGIYKLLKAAEDGAGVVKLKNLHDILQPGNEEEKQGLSWSESEYPYLVKMLTRYQQGLEIDQEQILIPRGLKSNLHPNFDKTDTLRFHYSYQTLPASIFSRLIVNLFRYCSAGSYGRNSFVLEKESESGKNRALIEQDGDNSIRLWIGGDQPCSDFLAVIREAFELIHQGFQELEVKAFLPLDEKYNLPVRAAYNALKKGRGTAYYHAEADREYNLVELMGHYYGSAVADRNVYNISGDLNIFRGNGNVAIDRSDNRQILNFNPQQLNDLTTFKIFLNEFLALARNTQDQQQISPKQRQQINELTDQVGSMLTNKAVPDKTKLQKLLAKVKTIFGGIDKTVSLAEKAGKCILYVNKLIEWLS